MAHENGENVRNGSRAQDVKNLHNKMSLGKNNVPERMNKQKCLGIIKPKQQKRTHDPSI